MSGAQKHTSSKLHHASAIFAMALCVFVLVAAEFMPISLLTPIADDFGVSVGQAGQAISISGLFAMLTCLVIGPMIRRADRRIVLLAMTVLLLIAVLMVGFAPNFAVFMIGRALHGIAVGGFWSIAMAAVMRMVPKEQVTRALGIVFSGNAVAQAFAAPLGSYLGAQVGWRGVFLCIAPVAVLTFVWQWMSLPRLPTDRATSATMLFRVLARRKVALAMSVVLLNFSGAFAMFTYLRPWLEQRIGASTQQVALAFLAIGLAGIVGTTQARRPLAWSVLGSMRGLLVLMAILPLLLLAVGASYWPVVALLACWGILNTARPVVYSTWVSRAVTDEAESGGALLVATIQVSLLVGSALGGELIDGLGPTAPFIASSFAMLIGLAIVGFGQRLAPNN